MMKISVIVPVYNSENTIEKCLISLKKQTYKNLEIIVINDGSVDTTEDKIVRIIENDKRFIYFKTANQGQSEARSFGLSKATGELIGFVDSDDFIDDDMYEILEKNMRDTKSDISILRATILFPNGFEIIPSCQNTFFTKTGNEMIFEYIGGFHFGIALWDKLYKRSLFDGLSLDTSFNLMEDALMGNYVFNKAKKIVYTGKAKYHYLQRKNSTARKNLEDSDLKAIGVVLGMKELYADSLELDKAFQRRFAQTILELLSKNPTKEQRKQIERALFETIELDKMGYLKKGDKLLIRLIYYKFPSSPLIQAKKMIGRAVRILKKSIE